MMFMVWPLLFYVGMKAASLRWQSFIVIIVAVCIGTAVRNYSAIEGAARLGEDQSFRWHPVVFAGDVAITTMLWAAVFLAGHLFGRWRRRKKD